MKKIILAGLLVFAVSCKNEAKTEIAVDVTDTTSVKRDTTMSAVPNCDSDPIILQLRNATARMDWIDKNGHLICQNGLEECITEFHIIPKSRFDSIVEKHPDNIPTPKEYKLKWSDIMNKIQSSGHKCYDKYVTFTFSGNAIDLKFADFAQSGTSSFYSIPLFNGIGQKYAVQSTEEIYFYKALIEEKENSDEKPVERVVFKIRDKYFDISSDPAKK